VCPNSYTNAMLQYSIKIEFNHVLQLFSPIVWVQSYYVSLVDAYCLGECNMLTPVISAPSQG